MRKFLLATAALIGLGFNPAFACEMGSGTSAGCTTGGELARSFGKVALPAIFAGTLVYIVYKDVQAGGMNRKLSDMTVTPGAGYKTNLRARLENNPELAKQVAFYDSAYNVSVAQAAQ